MTHAETPLILVADDQVQLQQELREAFEDKGWRVAVEGRAQGLPERLRSLRPDVLVLDISFPDGNGLEVLREIPDLLPDMPVVMLTGESYNVTSAIEAVRLGASHFLEKPFSRPGIVQAVRFCLETRQLRRENQDLWLGALEEMGIVGRSSEMLRLMELLRHLVDVPRPILITGESGTGKSMLAEALHRLSRRRRQAFYTIDFSQLPRELAHSELFGHRRGAFTGAQQDKAGLVEMAEGGTLFLDEIQDLPLDLQGKLKLFVERQRFTRIGEVQERSADTRLVLATNRNLAERVREGGFQHDLYERINILPLHLPGLNERQEDIPLLARRILRSECRELGKPFQDFEDAALFHLQSLDYRGRNIRRLKTLIQRAVVLADFRPAQPLIQAVDIRRAVALDEPATMPAAPSASSYHELMEQHKRWLLRRALEENGHSKTQAAQALGLSLDNFCKKLKALGE